MSNDHCFVLWLNHTFLICVTISTNSASLAQYHYMGKISWLSKFSWHYTNVSIFRSTAVKKDTVHQLWDMKICALCHLVVVMATSKRWTWFLFHSLHALRLQWIIGWPCHCRQTLLLSNPFSVIVCNKQVCHNTLNILLRKSRDSSNLL